jgi:signal recognition particle subunit SRP68
MDITRSITSERDRALLSGDHDVYHAQASRRIHTLRKRLGAATPKGRKYSPKALVTAENVASNIEWVQLLLACAERAWASAMAMKAAQSTENTQKPVPGSTKKQIASRLNRAISYAENLVGVLAESTAKASQLDALEAKAYLFMLKGTLDFEKERWQACLKNYSLPRAVYATLGKSGKSDVYKDLLSGVVEPSLRYASFKLKMPRTKPVEEIAIENYPSDERSVKDHLTELDSEAFQTTKEVAESRAETSDVPTHITWRTRKVKLEDATISEALGRAAFGEKSLTEKLKEYQAGKLSAADLAAAYDDVIEARQDAADATKAAIDELVAEGIDLGDARIQSLQVTRTAVNYAVIEYRIGRNRVLCGQADGLQFDAEQRKPYSKSTDGKERPTKPESSGRQLSRLRERTALYDSILQSLDAVKELPGVIADEAFVKELDAKYSYFRALKCLAIGRSHAVNGHVAQALALFARAQELAESAAAMLTTPSDSENSLPKLQISKDDLKKATIHLSVLVTRHRALTELKNLSANPTTASKTPATTAYARPLAETLHHNVYHDDVDLKNLVNYPPKLQPIPVKPLFFDLAWNYINYPGHEKDTVTPVSAANGAKDDEMEVERSSTPQPEKKKGWFSFGR